MTMRSESDLMDGPKGSCDRLGYKINATVSSRCIILLLFFDHGHEDGGIQAREPFASN